MEDKDAGELPVVTPSTWVTDPLPGPSQAVTQEGPRHVVELPDIRSLKDHGPYSGYCKVCWNPVYQLWVGDEPPPGTCVHCCENAAECPDSRGRSELKAALLKYKTEPK